MFAFTLYVVAPSARRALDNHSQPSIQESVPVASVKTTVKPSPTVANAEPLPDNRGTADAQSTPANRTKTVSLMPGQAFNVPNKQFRKIEVRSEYPLRVMTGPCHEDYTVEFFCQSDPADLFIADTRKPPLFLTPKANAVTIIATEF